MTTEFEYALVQRVRRNKITANAYAEPPEWSEWSEWQAVRTYPTLPGAAMAHNMSRSGVQRQYYEPKAATHEIQTKVAYRVVTKTWTPLLPELDGDE